MTPTVFSVGILPLFFVWFCNLFVIISRNTCSINSSIIYYDNPYHNLFKTLNFSSPSEVSVSFRVRVFQRDSALRYQCFCFTLSKKEWNSCNKHLSYLSKKCWQIARTGHFGTLIACPFILCAHYILQLHPPPLRPLPSSMLHLFS